MYYYNICYILYKNMYKTISISINTYQHLNALAIKLKKPKSQVIHDLILECIERIHDEEKSSLKSFNNSVKKLSKRVKLPRGLNLNFNDLTPANLLPDKDSVIPIKRKISSIKHDK